MPSPRTPTQRGRNYTVNIRMSRDEIEAARKLGSGNVSMGFRQAIRYAMDRDMEPIKLSSLLRSAAIMAQDAEDQCKQLKADAAYALKKRRGLTQPTTESVTFAMLPTPPATTHTPAAHSSPHVDAMHAMRLHWLHHGTEPPSCVRADS
jgi:hypothetical protein